MSYKKKYIKYKKKYLELKIHQEGGSDIMSKTYNGLKGIISQYTTPTTPTTEEPKVSSQNLTQEPTPPLTQEPTRLPIVIYKFEYNKYIEEYPTSSIRDEYTPLIYRYRSRDRISFITFIHFEQLDDDIDESITHLYIPYIYIHQTPLYDKYLYKRINDNTELINYDVYLKLKDDEKRSFKPLIYAIIKEYINITKHTTLLMYDAYKNITASDSNYKKMYKPVIYARTPYVAPVEYDDPHGFKLREHTRGTYNAHMYGGPLLR